MRSVKGCPFCHTNTIFVVKSKETAVVKEFQAQCDNCGARGPIYDSEAEAISGWEMGILDRGKRLRTN